MTLAWNGSRWSLVPKPNLGFGQEALFSVAASANGKDVWAVGFHPANSLNLYLC